MTSRRFGEYELDSARYQLRRDGRPLRLERIPMELLLLLAEKDGEVVTRQEIVERLWGRDIAVDAEHGINTAVRKIRAALREEGTRPRFVHTVHGKGYRFVAPTSEPLSNPEGGADPRPSPVEMPPGAGPADAGPRKRVLAAGLLALLLAGSTLFALMHAGLLDRALGRDPAPIRSLAVLPLANLSGDASWDYLADGMTDELITMLARDASLRVVSRTSAMQYKGARRPLREIARALGAEGILEGSITRSGRRVHVTVQLVRARTDTHVWAESYDRSLDSALSLPVEISRTVARVVGTATTPPAPSSRPIDPVAHDVYLRGRYLWYRGGDQQVRECFEKAIALQPDYAAAWSGLADYYADRAVGLKTPPRDVMVLARQAARRAVELDDTLPEAHNTMGAIDLFSDWDPQHADEEVRRAIALEPAFAEAHHLHSYVLTVFDRLDEAVEEQRRATELDPFARPWALGRELVYAGRLDAALADFRLRAEAQPRLPVFHSWLATVYWDQKMWRESAEEEEEACRVRGDEAGATAVRRAFGTGGSRAVALRDLEEQRARSRRGYVSPWIFAYLSAQLDRTDETLGYLEDAYREHCPRLVFLQYEPVFDFLHGDERYIALIRKTGLPLARRSVEASSRPRDASGRS
jgi:TolB-like protein/DNA-binding winged helix-turn-helix (wHTH) protein